MHKCGVAQEPSPMNPVAMKTAGEKHSKARRKLYYTITNWHLASSAKGTGTRRRTEVSVLYVLRFVPGWSDVKQWKIYYTNITAMFLPFPYIAYMGHSLDFLWGICLMWLALFILIKVKVLTPTSCQISAWVHNTFLEIFLSSTLFSAYINTQQIIMEYSVQYIVVPLQEEEF